MSLFILCSLYWIIFTSSFDNTLHNLTKDRYYLYNMCSLHIFSTSVACIYFHSLNCTFTDYAFKLEVQFVSAHINYKILGSKLTADVTATMKLKDGSLGRKAMTNLHSILKGRDQSLYQQKSV